MEMEMDEFGGHYTVPGSVFRVPGSCSGFDVPEARGTGTPNPERERGTWNRELRTAM
jgi:hypothetical protein